MRLREHLADPWGGVIAALAGGLTWAVLPAAPLAVPLALGVAAAVYAGKVAAGVLLDRGDSGPGDSDYSPAPLPEPPRGSPARGWLVRAERAARALDELATSAGTGATADRLHSVRDGAGSTVSAMRRLAGQVTTFDQAMARIDATRLVGERKRLTRELRGGGNDELRAAREQALGSVTHQLEVFQRLESSRDTLLAQMQSTALRLEGLGAQAAELVALSSSAGATQIAEDRLVTELTEALDGMRAGLAEVQAQAEQIRDV